MRSWVENGSSISKATTSFSYGLTLMHVSRERLGGNWGTQMMPSAGTNVQESAERF